MKKSRIIFAIMLIVSLFVFSFADVSIHAEAGKPSKPTIKVKALAGGAKITISKGKNAEAFEIYIKPSTDNKYRLTKIVSANGKSKLTTEISDLKPGKYSFKVRGYTASSQGKFSKAKTVSVKKQAKNSFNTIKDGNSFSSANVGDVIIFGSYEQDNNSKNGKEPIEWIVLDKLPGGKLFVISKYALDAQPYNTNAKNITWEKSSLRKWLNSTFYDEAFTEDQKNQIFLTTVENNDNPRFNGKGGKDTEDYVFLLSIEEAERYYKTETYGGMGAAVGNDSPDRECQPTAYAQEQGASVWTELMIGEGSLDHINGWWWLRSPGGEEAEASFITPDGNINYSGCDVSRDFNCVRPAMIITDISKAGWVMENGEWYHYEADGSKSTGTFEGGWAKYNLDNNGKLTGYSSQYVAITDLSKADVGNAVYFGFYEQDNNVSDGVEPIEWIVLDKYTDGSLLLLSRYGLDCKPYNDEWEEITWENCTIRSWLNEGFLNSAFSNSDKKCILKTTLTNDANPYYQTSGGKNTKDYVFLLSSAEYDKYFSYNEEAFINGTSLDWASSCAPTAYTIALGVYTSTFEDFSYGNSWWWLRTPGPNLYSVSTGDIDNGSVSYTEPSSVEDIAIRPAIVIKP